MRTGFVNSFSANSPVSRDMGFIKDMRRIVSALPQKHQSLFFSATMSRETGEFAEKLLTNPVRIEATPQASTLECIKQSVFFVDQNNKYPLLQGLIRDEEMERVLIFSRTKHRVDKIAEALNKNKINADAIHGNKSQNQRTKAMHDFKSGACGCLWQRILQQGALMSMIYPML